VTPLSVKVLALTMATTEPETIVAPLTAFFVPLTVSMRALAPEVCSLPPEMLTPASSSRVGLLVPLIATEPLLTNLPPSVRVAPLPITMAPALTPMPVPSVAVKVPPVTSSVAPLEVAMLPTVGLSAAVLLTIPPTSRRSCPPSSC